MAHQQRGGNNGDGRRDSDGDGWRNGKVVAMTVMDGAMATAITRQRHATTAAKGATVTRWPWR